MRVNEHVVAENDSVAQQWLALVASFDHLDAPRSRVEFIAARYRKQPCRVVQRIQGAFNYCFRIRFDDANDEWIIRFPIPGYAMDPCRKTQNEVDVMRFIQSNTTIPIPKVFGSGVADGDFDGLGPYIVMEYVHGLSLDDLILENDEEWALRKDCPAETIEKVYRQIACIYLQLFQHSFPKIGSLSAVDSDGVAPEWRLASGPLTFKMNEVERMGGVRIGASDGPFDQTIDYFQTLVDQSLSHLLHNPHAGRDEQEIQADRHSIDTLGSLARHFSSKGNVENQYRLFCDDLRFGNILVDESYQIVAVLDWEFCYVAPQSFLCSPPSWLIGTEPFEWKDDDVAYFTEKVGLFLSLLGEEEEKRDENDHRLSHLMRDSMRDGTFWFNLAIRESFPLSDIMSHCRNLEAFQNLTLYCGSSSDRKVTDKTPERQKWRAVDNSSLSPFLSTMWKSFRSSLPTIDRISELLKSRGRSKDVHVGRNADERQ